MNGKRVFVLRGTSKVGKSRTIRLVLDNLLALYPDALREWKYEINNRVDVRAILTINDVKIGIESQGDPNSRLESESLDLFLELGCEIIVCATRTRGRTVEAVERLERDYGYTVTWMEKTWNESAERDACNSVKAMEILEAIKEAIEAPALAQ